MAVRRLASWSQAVFFGQVGYVFTFLSSRACERKWRKDHVTGRRQPNRSQSFRSVPISDAGMITTAAVNSAIWTMVCHFALKTDPVSCVRTGCQKPGLHKPRLRHRRIVARPLPRQKQRRKQVRPWTIRWSYTHQKTLYTLLPSVPSPKIRPRPSGRKQPQVPLNPSPWLPASWRWDGPAPTGRTTAGRGRLNVREDTARKNVVSGSQEDRRSATCDRPVHSQPPHGSSTLQDGDARVRPISHQKSGVDGIDRHTRCLSSCANASGCPQVSAFRGQQEGVPVHLSSVWTGDFSTGVHQAAKTHRLAVEAARCEATRLLRRLADQGRYTGTSSTAHPDNHQGPPVSWLDHQLRKVRPHTKSRLPVHWDAVQHSTFHSGAPAENACKGPVSSSTLDGQSEHNCQRSAQICMLVFMASLVRRGRLRLRPVQWWAATAWCQRTGNWSDRIQVPQWVLSEVAWWSSPAVLQGLPLATKETEVTLFTDASSSGWGAQLGSRSTQGQWSASQRLCHINVLEMQAVIYAVRDFLPHLRYRVVRLICDNAVTVAYIKNEGGTSSHTLMQMTIRLLKWCDSKAITLVPVHLPGVHNIQADSLSRVGQTLTTEWTMAMESLRPVFAKWGEPQIDMFTTFANRRLKFVSPYPDPRAEWTDAMSMPWDKERGLLYAFSPFKMVPQVLQKMAQSPGVQVILITQLQPAASWFPELMDLSQEDPIPLFVEGQDLLTQEVCMGGGLTETPHFRPSNLHAWKLSGPFWEQKVIPGKLPAWCQDAYKNLHNKWMNLIGQDSWRSVGRKVGTCFESEVINSVPLQGRTTTLNDYITSHVCGFCATSLGVWSSSRPAYQVAGQGFPAGMSGATQNHAQVGSSSGFIVITETAVYISKWGRWGILGWRHSPKMADAQMCVPVSIGFGETVLVPARIEYSAWQMCVRERKHSRSTCGISTSGTWLPGKESATDAGPWMDHGTWDCSLESDGTGANVMSRGAAEALHTGLGKNPGGPAANVHSLEPQHQRYHEEPHKPMDRGDCQGSLHSSWSSVWPCDSAWGPSAFSFMGVHLSGGFTWHPVSGFLEVIWGLPELIPAWHGLYCWGHVNTGSSGGRTTRRGSRASSPTSLAYTICMQPLLRRS